MTDIASILNRNLVATRDAHGLISEFYEYIAALERGILTWSPTPTD